MPWAQFSSLSFSPQFTAGLVRRQLLGTAGIIDAGARSLEAFLTAQAKRTRSCLARRGLPHKKPEDQQQRATGDLLLLLKPLRFQSVSKRRNRTVQTEWARAGQIRRSDGSSPRPLVRPYLSVNLSVERQQTPGQPQLLTSPVMGEPLWDDTQLFLVAPLALRRSAVTLSSSLLVPLRPCSATLAALSRCLSPSIVAYVKMQGMDQGISDSRVDGEVRQGGLTGQRRAHALHKGKDCAPSQ